MNKFALRTLFIIILTLTPALSENTYTLSEFQDGNSTVTYSWTEASNATKYFYVPKNATFISTTLDITGSVDISTCTQEHAQTNYTCGGTDGGYYSTYYIGSAVKDGSYSTEDTFSSGGGHFVVYYEKPDNVYGTTGHQLYLRDQDGTTTVNIPSSCFNHNPDDVRIAVDYNSGWGWYCDNGGGDIKHPLNEGFEKDPLVIIWENGEII